MSEELPAGSSVPDGTIGIPHGDGTFTLIRRCDVCWAAIIETHDADYQMHIEWHDRTGTNLPPTS